jgi:superfamily II DNA or RNA helicase
VPKRINAKTGSELFIVDNSDDEWKVLRYLRDWCQISQSVDIATAYFEIGGLLALEGEWQRVDTIRVLMGDEVARRTAKAFQQSLNTKLNLLDSSIEAEKDIDDFLSGVPAIVAAVRSGKIRFRVYRKAKFHAKAYITHARLEVIGSAALVGSSNLTRPGITQNIELNVQITGQPVSVLQDWYEEHWDEAEEITADIFRIIERHVREYSPYEIYAKSLIQYFKGREESAGDWEKTESNIWPILDGYQREGYGALLKVARKYGGAFLCDGVGLGKTFIGLMVLERLIRYERKNVLLLVPKSASEPVWLRNIRRHLPDLADNVFSSLFVLNHTDLSRNSLSRQIEQAKQRADAIIVDEAHNFRNPGLAGKGRMRPSRYRVLKDLAAGKEMFLLTATPVNNSLLDLMHMVELFEDDGSRLKQAPLGVHSLRGHFRVLEQRITEVVDDGQGDLFDQVDQNVLSGDAQKVFAADPLVNALVVQRSRAYVQESQSKEAKGAALFPKRADPKVADYRFSKLQKALLDKVERAFNRSRPLFSLAVYYPYGWARNALANVDDFQIGRQKQVVALIRTGFLKRFESSTVAFDYSCQNLLLKLLAFVERHCETSSEKRDLERWKGRNEGILDYVRARQARWVEAEQDEEGDLISDEMKEEFDHITRDEFDVPAIIHETFEDLNQLSEFLHDLRDFTAANDGKLATLINLIRKDKVLREHKLLIFSEYMATARYLREELEKAGVSGIAQVDSATKIDRTEVIRRFAPYYNGSSSAELQNAGIPETRVLISTDVLSEGLNPQDATRVINYDLHWNPVRLMQRIGRVDRRLHPEVEKQIVDSHPAEKTLRRSVAFWNFLPPDDLDRLLAIYNRVAGKTLRISKLFGIEGRKLLTPQDDYDALRDFNHDYEGDQTPEERLRNELRDLLGADPALAERVEALPGRTFSGKKHPKPGTQAVFFCYALPGRNPDAATDAGAEAWSEADGRVVWLLRDLAGERIIEDAPAIVEWIRSMPDTPRQCIIPRQTLREVRIAVERHLKDGYLRQVQAPVGVRPALKAWMELS